MNIKEVQKKDGTTVYKVNVYLGVDSLTGKQVAPRLQPRTVKRARIKLTKL